MEIQSGFKLFVKMIKGKTKRMEISKKNCVRNIKS